MEMYVHCIEVIRRAYVTGNTAQHYIGPKQRVCQDHSIRLPYIKASAGVLSAYQNVRIRYFTWIVLYAGLFLANFRRSPTTSPHRRNVIAPNTLAPLARRICSNNVYHCRKLIIAARKQPFLFTCCNYQFFIFDVLSVRCRGPPIPSEQLQAFR